MARGQWAGSPSHRAEGSTLASFARVERAMEDSRTGDIYICDLHLNTIKVKARDFR
jgi:hypothetical protein